MFEQSGEYTFEQLVEHILGLPQKYGQKTIAIDGPGGVGKSTFARVLVNMLPNACTINIDGFFKCIDDWGKVQSSDGVNQDFDWDRYQRDVLDSLVHGRQICYQVYNWDRDALDPAVSVPEDAILILEGGYITQKRFREMYDVTLWIDMPDAARLERIIARDGEDRRQYWEDDWMPKEQRYVDIQKPKACVDLLIDGASIDYERRVFHVVR